MKTYQQFNESIRDKMTPKSEEDIKKSLQDASPERKIEVGCEEGILWLVKNAVDEGVDVNDVDYIKTALNNGYIDIVTYLLNQGAIIKVHINEIGNNIDESEIESQLNQEGTFEGDDNFEREMREGYDYALKQFLVGYVTRNRKTGELPDNYFELLDSAEIELVSEYHYFKNFRIKIGEPVWFY